MTNPGTHHPGTPLIARVLLTDATNRVLIVHTIGSVPRWILPGGLVDAQESPRAAARREVQEELGLDVEVGPLLTQEWTPPRTPGRRARLTFYFTGPQLSHEDVARIALQETEVDAMAWAERDRARELLPTTVALHVGGPLHAYSGSTYYFEHPPRREHDHLID
ncbi:NUDIX hydrolase [Streptomyces swartbergensis]|uniref:NUDIX hydrolase n=1 Tax=Streptomyces swartbergensis TaxID=487165 RepID=UPI00244AB3E0|nr:NUDIX hydrolase [Streptomyces swartbergensis]